jgi:hypothetical protein
MLRVDAHAVHPDTGSHDMLDRPGEVTLEVIHNLAGHGFALHAHIMDRHGA